MSEPTWQRYLGDHMQGVRAAFPTAEIVHNSIWFAGETPPISCASTAPPTLINLERGVNDAGLTGGTGKWSLQELLAFADHRQAEGHGVVFDATSTTAAGRLYGLAAYFLISSGRDGLGNDQGGTPTDWWTGYDVDLGAPLAGRYVWNGVIRRDFERGYTLVNEPGAITRTLTLPAGSRDLTGAAKTTVTLTAASGAVYTTADGTDSDPDPHPDPDTDTDTGPGNRRQRQFHACGGGQLRCVHVESDGRPAGLDARSLLAHARLRALFRLAPELVLEGLGLPERVRHLPRQQRRHPASRVDPARRRRQQALHPGGVLRRQVRAVRRRHRQPRLPPWWIDQSRARLAMGYAGIYIDDVNLYRKVSNGLGQMVDPIDPRTGAVLTEPTWQRYLGDHMQGVRAAFPTTEIVHNAIWYAGDTTADQLRVHRAASLINVERGVNDAGVTGGTGKWSLQGLLAFADHRQAEGHGVVFDAASTTAAGRLYGLAAYFLVSSGRDALGNNQGGTPTDWWTGYDVDLGSPLAGRYLWNGLIRRDFEGGFALVNEPGAVTRTVALPAGASDLDRHDTDEPDARRGHGGRIHHPVSARVDVDGAHVLRGGCRSNGCVGRGSSMQRASSG